MIKTLILVLALACVLAAPPAARAQDDDAGPLIPGVAVNERVLQVPGDPSRPSDITVTLLTPPGPGPLPLVVANHGADDDTRAHVYRRTFFAYYFLSRGYAVAMPMMRGFAGTGGRQTDYGCDVAAVGRDNARDIRAVIANLAARPGIDASRVVVIGQSFGGWNALALGADPDPRPGSQIVGLINASGGIRSTSCPEDDRELTRAVGGFGRGTQLPSIWLYADNDPLFPAKLWRAMYAEYVKAGARAELVYIGHVEGEAHAFSKYPEDLPLWTPRLDAFLAGLGLPSRPVNPQYLPKPWPKSTGFAAVNDVAGVPYVNDQGRDLYRKYLRKPISKAFVLSPAGFVDAQYGGFDPLKAAMDACRAAHKPCRPYAVDDQVVWVPPPPRPPPSAYAAITDAKAVPYLTDPAAQALYQRFLAHPGPRALVISPDGGAAAEYGGWDPYAAAWLTCAAAKLICEPYAVDDQVVYVPPPPLPTASGFAKLQDVNAVPGLKPDGREGYSAYLARPLPRAFAVAPDGAWTSGSGGKATAREVLAACRKTHPDCKLYAIDGDVVWK